MRPYNLLVIDERDCVCRIEPLTVADEEAAIAVAELVAVESPRLGYELWQGGSRIRVHRPPRPTPN